MPPEECIRQVYLRISRKTVSGLIKRPEALTPYELTAEIERLTGCETDNFAYIAESAFFDGTADISGKNTACAAYENIRAAVKKHIKEQKKLGRINRKGKR